ncbi:hypothetical protein [Ferrimonas balearica]|uniref:hypothetical protein n=1 Tax=Ferrimonas balearica TaxID=44012 RepID=UPI001C99E292|nr:hypothetical protein [Ferrimonas balearica]MBY5992535.1 hypothetical protein [Ferrimonas balearica]
MTATRIGIEVFHDHLAPMDTGWHARLVIQDEIEGQAYHGRTLDLRAHSSQEALVEAARSFHIDPKYILHP